MTKIYAVDKNSLSQKGLAPSLAPCASSLPCPKAVLLPTSLVGDGNKKRCYCGAYAGVRHAQCEGCCTPQIGLSFTRCEAIPGLSCLLGQLSVAIASSCNSQLFSFTVFMVDRLSCTTQDMLVRQRTRQ
jgi:hypothetical protein